MKTRFICFLAAGLLILSAGICSAGPRAVPMDSTYEFEPLAEGQGLVHEFIIKNQGDADLNILGVIPP